MFAVFHQQLIGSLSNDRHACRYNRYLDEPHWVEVLTEVLLSLLTRPSSLFRHVVDQVFIVLAPHLTLNALKLCLEVSVRDVLACKVRNTLESPSWKMK